MSKYFVLLLLVFSCDFINPEGDTQKTPDFKTVEVTYRIDGRIRDASISFMRGDSTIFPSHVPNLNLKKIPFSYSFRADYPQLLSISAQLLDPCFTESCDVTASILIDGEIHREWKLNTVFSNQAESVMLRVFTLSAWGKDEDLKLRYSLSNSSIPEGEVRYKDPEGWKSIVFTEQQTWTGSPAITVQPGFVANAELTISSKVSANSETDFGISARDSLERTIHGIGLRFINKEESYGKTAKISLPIHGY